MRPIELAKWAGAVAMVTDHAAKYVFTASAVTEAIGSLAFPLFVYALAEGAGRQHGAARERTLLRLFAWAGGAQLLGVFVRDDLGTLNVLYTLGLGVFIDTAWTRGFQSGPLGRYLWLLAGAVALAFAQFVEYQWIGALLVFAAMRWAATGRDRWAAIAISLLPLLVVPNGNHFALLAPVVLVGLWAFVRVDLPRVRHAFYFLYALQWPALGLLRGVL